MTMARATCELSEVFDLFERHGRDAYGEDVSQIAHALQSAHHAARAGESETMIVAALLHDVGQLLHGAGAAAEREGRDARHELGGAAYLSRWFGEAVLAPIRLHVAAKRYLCWHDPDYLAALSGASVLSLRLQGGPFSAAEADAFLGLPFAAEAVRLRRYDDSAKDPAAAVPPLDSYRSMVSALAS